MINNKLAKSQGFTLVELSIVIIIIGFLVAGIAAGTSLIKQAGLNSIISDIQTYQVAYNTFVIRYDAIPGDMKNASAYWGSGTCSVLNANYCNGDGDGLIWSSGQPISSFPSDESTRAWKHMSLAGLLPTLSNMPLVGASSSSPGYEAIINAGITAPASKKAGLSYSYYGISDWVPTFVLAWPDTDNHNALYVSKVTTVGSFGQAYFSGGLTPEDTFSIDTKIDDGSVDSSGNAMGASTGSFRAIEEIPVTSTGICHVGGLYSITSQNATCTAGQKTTK